MRSDRAGNGTITWTLVCTLSRRCSLSRDLKRPFRDKPMTIAVAPQPMHAHERPKSIQAEPRVLVDQPEVPIGQRHRHSHVAVGPRGSRSRVYFGGRGLMENEGCGGL